MANKTKYVRKVWQEAHYSSNSLVRSYWPTYVNSYVRTGNNLPKYKRVIAIGASATNAMSIDVKTVIAKTAKCRACVFKNKPPLQYTGPYIWGSTLPQNPSWTNLPDFRGTNSQCESDASIEILKKIRKTQSQMMGGVFLKELGQTIQLITNPVSGLRRLLSTHLKKVNKNTKQFKARRDSDNIQRVLADTWLETQFGVVPLLNDVKDGALALARLHSEKRKTRVSCIVQREVHVRASASTTAVNGSLLAMKFDREKNVFRTSYHVGLDASTDYDETPGSRLGELAGFNLADFVPTVWECLPWSFLIDYFSNIGDVLTARNTDTSKVTWVSKCDISERVIEVTERYDLGLTLKGNPTIVCTSWSDSQGSYVSSSKWIRRSAGLEYPTLNFELPTGPFKLANIVALIVSGKRTERSLRFDGGLRYKSLF